MGVVTARLVFLAFFGLTGTIIYNALYLQDQGLRGAGVPATTTAQKTGGALDGSSRVGSVSKSDANLPPASTDLQPLDSGSGESRLVVRAVQRELAARGYDVGQVDGTLSDKTRAAISAFQTERGLVVTGAPSDELLRQILLGDSVEDAAATGSVARPTDSAGSDDRATVKRIQQTLADLGYAPGPIDGAWGENTAQAISAFQRDRNIAETGRITPELLGEVQRVTGVDVTENTQP